MRPDFTPHERYLIASVLTRPSGSGLHFDLAYLLPGLLLASLAFKYDEPGLFFAAWTVILCFKVWEWRRNRIYAPLWKSVVQKYELALCDANPPTDSAS